MDSFDGNLDMITAYCNHFYIAFQRINRRKDVTPPNVFLTDRETEVRTQARLN